MPPLSLVMSALPVFDAVARLGSFSLAAEELNITQSAVSHRIKQLEQALGISLVHRTTRQLELTAEGQRLAEAAKRALTEVSQVLGLLCGERNEGVISISALSSIAVKWLVPHLADFHDEHPQLGVSVLASDEISDLRKDPVDCGLRFATGGSPGLHSTYLVGDWLVPLASPGFFKDKAVPDRAEDLAQFALQEAVFPVNAGTYYSWQTWFDAMGAEVSYRTAGPQFSRADMMIQAAIAGQGIILSRAMLLEQDLIERGLLVQVGKAIPCPFSYYFVTLPEKADWPKIIFLRDWLKREMGKTYRKITSLLDKLDTQTI
ncbi:LysR substrate-binding domain-containing protein [Emcibacter nanhaiensis]|uniref:LysR family transcriptional regulator n=1 Tax=Emcibacter nanhaiensis TaxID=1505037 RepID=A0A501PN82_9PROT|nr:LysR substrate-binding domain-containing protein [Emcibacter nanhaiensis]TPD61618.1 LysR family transcriptional regulator [Emcibacter nanhaiensis]